MDLTSMLIFYPWYRINLINWWEENKTKNVMPLIWVIIFIKKSCNSCILLVVIYILLRGLVLWILEVIRPNTCVLDSHLEDLPISLFDLRHLYVSRPLSFSMSRSPLSSLLYFLFPTLLWCYRYSKVDTWCLFNLFVWFNTTCGANLSELSFFVLVDCSQKC